MNLICYFCVRVICEDILPNLSKEQGGRIALLLQEILLFVE